jgi:hypothetical protein
MTSASPAQLIETVRNYYRPDRIYDNSSESSPESKRLTALWDRVLKDHGQWLSLLSEVRRELPGCVVGDATATCDASLKCTAYIEKTDSHERVVVGCLSILAPVYVVYGVTYDIVSNKRDRATLSLEQLPAEMRPAAYVVSSQIEARFGATALPIGVAQTRIPFYVDWQEPPKTMLFHALFTSEPTHLP